MSVVIATLLSSLSTMGIAGQYPAECIKNNGRLIPQLAKSCYGFCNEPGDLFLMSRPRLKNCQKILRLSPLERVDKIQLAASGGAHSDGTKGKLQACLAAAAELLPIDARIEKKVDEYKQAMRDKSEEVRKRIQRKIANLRASFPEFPGCVPSPQALLPVYDCLVDESQRVTTSYQAVVDKGYQKKDVKLCAIKGAVHDSVALELISIRFSDLIARFDDIDDCKAKIKEWNSARIKKVCESKDQPASPECKNRIQRDIAATDREIQKAQAKSDKARKAIDSVKQDIRAIDEIINQIIAQC